MLWLTKPYLKLKKSVCRIIMSGKSKKKKQISPFSVLKEIERSCIAKDVGLPIQEEIRDQWSGISFKIDQQQFVAGVGDVLEILQMPELSKVPRSCSWMLGIANIRGNLLPVMDLKSFLINETTVLNRRNRVLVVNTKGVMTGLLVDESMGIKKFFIDNHIAIVSDVPDQLSGYVNGGYKDEHDNIWFKFNMQSLSEKPLFFRAAI
ncbi:MAG: chemotaxis protein CheW [Gammaproteobacteria bacterium]|nr:MAG: chemotaxis protein CheW [Gammaproteobacteria bacterium]